MFSSLNKNGQAAIICSQGVLFRGGEEEEIRKNMIKEDIIEGVVALTAKAVLWHRDTWLCINP